MAGECGAAISVHAPLSLNDGLTTNKLRGFEAPAHSPRILLLDSDVLVLGDLGGLVDAVPADAMAASPAGNARVPEAEWEAIYDALGLPRPTERILSIRAELGLRPRVPMYPYFNSGVLLLPRAVDLGGPWARDVAAIGALGRQTASDQAGLATALHRRRLAGVPFQRLPTPYHVCPPHFQGDALGLDDVRLFHAVGFLRGLQKREEIEPLMEAYLAKWTGELRWDGDREKAASFLRKLWREHVEPRVR